MYYKKIAIMIIKKYAKKVKDHYELNDAHIYLEKDDIYMIDDNSSGHLSYKEFIKMIESRIKNYVVIKKN